MTYDENDLRDALARLADRAPETCVVGDTEVLRAGSTGRSGRLVTVLGAAVVAVLVLAAVVYGLTRHRSGSSGPAADDRGAGGHPVTVTCTSPTGAAASPDAAALSRRLRAMGGHLISVVARADTLTAQVRGLAADDLGQVCTEGVLRVRPLVTPPVAVTCVDAIATPERSASAPSRAAGPGASCLAGAVAAAARTAGFAVPSTDREYDALPQAHRRALLAALARTACNALSPGAPKAARPTVACTLTGATAGSRTAALLGPAVLGPDDLAGARALAPDAAAGQVGWTVSLPLTDRARAAFATWTSAHNTQGALGAPAAACAATGTPCGDFLSVTVDDAVLAVPVTLAPVTAGIVRISGDFDEATSKALAAELTGGPLPVPLQLTGVR